MGNCQSDKSDVIESVSSSSLKNINESDAKVLSNRASILSLNGKVRTQANNQGSAVSQKSFEISNVNRPDKNKNGFF